MISTFKQISYYAKKFRIEAKPSVFVQENILNLINRRFITSYHMQLFLQHSPSFYKQREFKLLDDKAMLVEPH